MPSLLVRLSSDDHIEYTGPSGKAKDCYCADPNVRFRVTLGGASGVGDVDVFVRNVGNG